MKMNNKLDRKLQEWGIILIGTICVAVAINVFFLPNKIVNGGVSGMATILYHTFGISSGTSFSFLNAILLLLAWKILGKIFVFRQL